jgi:hypothetical protein
MSLDIQDGYVTLPHESPWLRPIHGAPA